MPSAHGSLDRDAILAAADLRALADELLTPTRSKDGARGWSCPDPDHRRTGPEPNEVTLYTSRRGEQRWSCMGCGAGGTAIDLVMKARQLRYGGALRYLADHGRRRPRPAERSVPMPEQAPERRDGPVSARSGLDAWTAHAADLLWQQEGEPVRRWLSETRGIPQDVLRINKIGATAITPTAMLPTRRTVQGHRSSAPAAVLPVIAKDRAIYVQLRLIELPTAGAAWAKRATDEPVDDLALPKANAQHDQPRYISVTGSRTCPRVGLYRPARRLHPEILVTEGILDALSANAAGYRAAAVLSPGLAEAEASVHLARLQGPLVLALDPDNAGDRAAERLMHHLTARGRRPTRLSTLPGDLNEALVASRDWSRKLAAHVRHAIASAEPDSMAWQRP